MEENSEEKEEREKATPKHNLYNFTLCSYFMRKEIGIPISSPDAKAIFVVYFQFLSYSLI